MEPTPIIWTPGNVGVGIFNLGRPKIDSGNADRRNWDGTVTSAIESAELAGQLDLFHGDIGRAWIDATEEIARFQGKVTPLRDQHVVVRLENGAGIVLDKVRAELRDVKVDFNTNRKVQVSKFTLRSMAVADAAKLVGLQNTLVKVTVQMQVPDKRDNDFTPEVGQIVSGVTNTGQTVVGRMTGVDTDTDLVILDDFGAEYQIAKVASAYTLESTVAQDADSIASLYYDQVVANGGEPAWSSIVEAVAEATKAGEVQRMSGSTMYLNNDVIQRAIAKHELPAEPGVAEG